MANVIIADLLEWKQRGKKIAMLTAYDYPMAKLVDAAGADLVLVGDSLGMVVLGYKDTAGVTMDEMIHHAKAARRGVTRALLIGDMPLVALRVSAAEALRHAKRFVQEAGCEAVKVEWRQGIEAIARTIVAAGIPVMGHVGLTPQTASEEGGFGMRGKDVASAVTIVTQARALQEAGCFAMVLECLPDEVAQELTTRLRVPTIGIGSGPSCDGQVLVTYDLLGLYDRRTLRFVKRYADLSGTIRQAATAYIRDVQTGVFPGPEHTVQFDPNSLGQLRAQLAALQEHA